MDMSTYIRKIKTALGSSVVDIEIPDKELTNIVNDSLDEVKAYIVSTKYMTVPYKPIIDLTDKKVYNVFEIFRGDAGMATPMGMTMNQFGFGIDQANSILLTGATVDYSGYQYDMMDSLMNQIAVRKLASSARGLNDIDFQYDNSEKKLYVDMVGTTNNITIEYVPDYDSVDELSDPYWQNILLRCARANTKLAIGRIRSKYTIQGQLYTLDGTQLIQEGTTEKKDLMDSLEKSALGVLQILD